MATISDVAKLSGISVSTVSRVINDSPHVSQDKRKRILDAMHQLGYVPMQAARQMRGSGSRNIAVVVPTITNPFFAYLVNAVEKTCREMDYKTLIIQTYGERNLEENALNLLRFQHVDGVILCAMANEWSLIESYAQYGKIVVCNEYNDSGTISMIKAKQYEGFYRAAEFLLERGYTQIGYCTGSQAIVLQPIGISISSDRYRGYAEALSDHEIVAHPQFLFTNVYTFEDGQRVMREIWQLDKRPDALITGSDQVAAGMMLEAKKLGIQIPKDIALMGVDDQPIATQLEIPLTTIHQPVEEEGRLAAQELIRQLTEEKDNPIKIELELTLAVRESV